MNYLIWQGRDSRDIKGLIISELSPISKPQMRIAETVIDGVDGSYIEELGYASYDKPLLIGITPQADVNEVIKFFSGQGNVVFSNEPDKYYKAHIINQIDYIRLVRFRTATVTFKVQPFKYEHQEELSRKEITRANKGGKNKIDLRKCVFGNCTLNEDGSITSAINNGYYSYVETTDLNEFLMSNLGETITFSTGTVIDGKMTSIIIYGTLSDGRTYQESVETGTGKSTLTISKDFTEIVRLQIRFNRSADAFTDTTTNIAYVQLELGGEATGYEKYVDGEISVTNSGNYFAKPKIEIKGTGTVAVTVNGNTLFRYTFPDGENTVVIDSQKQDAYEGTVLKNRNMVGEFPTFEIGENIISWEGNITSLSVSYKSRWI